MGKPSKKGIIFTAGTLLDVAKHAHDKLVELRAPELFRIIEREFGATTRERSSEKALPDVIGNHERNNTLFAEGSIRRG